MEDWESLSVEEKTRALKVLIKNLEFSRFNYEQELGAENALDAPNEALLYEYQSSIDKIERKQQYYKDQLVALEGEE